MVAGTAVDVDSVFAGRAHQALFVALHGGQVPAPGHEGQGSVFNGSGGEGEARWMGGGKLGGGKDSNGPALSQGRIRVGGKCSPGQKCSEAVFWHGWVLGDQWGTAAGSGLWAARLEEP